MTRHEAQAFINSLVNLRTDATDTQALGAVAVYPEWKADVEYKAGIRVLHNGILYRVLQDHTSQETWMPDTAASLFAKVLIPDDDIIPQWEQPESTNPYKKGDKVVHKDTTWISIVDDNIWEPGVYGWEQI